MRPLRILVVFGTRPEAIKLAPVIQRLAQDPAIQLHLCVTAQHRHMLDQVLRHFTLTPDVDLNLMQSEQDLTDLTTRMLQGLKPVLQEYRPQLVMVHGDTTTTFAASLAAFYQKIPVAHIEAGLRTFDRHAPFPEEINRRLTALLADWHFAPTEQAKQHLLHEGVAAERIWVTGNTVVDALFHTLQKMTQTSPLVVPFSTRFPQLSLEKPLILITSHRRENWGEGQAQICEALATLAQQQSDWQFAYPLHPNPRLQAQVQAQLGEQPNLFLLPPQDYPDFVMLIACASVILTDSGGIQEEAAALGKSVLIMRDHSERPEAIQAGTAQLVGTDSTQIIAATTATMARVAQPIRFFSTAPLALNSSDYGDGLASERIVSILKESINCL